MEAEWVMAIATVVLAAAALASLFIVMIWYIVAVPFSEYEPLRRLSLYRRLFIHIARYRLWLREQNASPFADSLSDIRQSLRRIANSMPRACTTTDCDGIAFSYSMQCKKCIADNRQEGA